jgi:hypothetical protein
MAENKIALSLGEKIYISSYLLYIIGKSNPSQAGELLFLPTAELYGSGFITSSPSELEIFAKYIYATPHAGDEKNLLGFSNPQFPVSFVKNNLFTTDNLSYFKN